MMQWKLIQKQYQIRGEALAMLDKLQLSFEENDADKEVLQSVLSLTKKSGKCESNQRKKKLSEIFSNNDLM